MANFHFEFEGASYNAEADIILENGKIVCSISRILGDRSDQQAGFDGYELGLVVENELPLSKAIYCGLHKYLKNYPVNHCS